MNTSLKEKYSVNNIFHALTLRIVKTYFLKRNTNQISSTDTIIPIKSFKMIDRYMHTFK